MFHFLSWYLIVSFVGFLSFPLVYRLFSALPSRGYAIARILGILLWGYLFWIFTSLGITNNDIGGILLALTILLILTIWAFQTISIVELQEWMRSNSMLLVVVEILFFVAFGGWCVVRAANPEILGTEKPMELAFINAILRSQSFPPNDPWLSGYAISYYYFGYVLVAMMAKMTNISGGIAFNLGISMVFALSALGAYGLLYDLLIVYAQRKSNNVIGRRGKALKSLLAPFWILIISNFEGFLHVLHNRGLFWRFDSQGNLTSSFWKWLDMRELSQPPSIPFSWIPKQHWWWWRASRVVQDYDLSGNWKEIIDEFPFFSYLLGDLHPHVLAMPFAFLALTTTLNLFFNLKEEKWIIFGQRICLSKIQLIFAMVALGGLAFLNTWDFPIYVAIFCGAYLLKRLSVAGWNKESFWETVILGFMVGIGGIILYLPFYLGFSSQAGGILPNLINPTRGAHLWVMFGPLLIPIFLFLTNLWQSSNTRSNLFRGMLFSFGIILILWLFSLIFGLITARLPILGDIYLSSLGAIGNSSDLLRQSVIRRMTYSGGWLTILILLGMTIGLNFKRHKDDKDDISISSVSLSVDMTKTIGWDALPTSHLFVLLLILSGTGLVLIPEFFFLRDQFGWRMNTIFKFYYQAWLLWGIASAYGISILWREARGVWQSVFKTSMVGVMVMSLIYPSLSIWDKTSGFNPPQGLTLDGAAYFEIRNPNEMAAVRWLQFAPPGFILEAVGQNGGSYSEYARISTLTGLPTVLGWVGHENQWRGGSKEMGTRMGDIELIYRSNNWEQVEQLLYQYQVKYIYIGSLERSRYNVNESKFMQNLNLVFEQGEVRIYQFP